MNSSSYWAVPKPSPISSPPSLSSPHHTNSEHSTMASSSSTLTTTSFLPSTASLAAPPSTKKASVIGVSSFRVECRKKDLHPEFYTDAKVYCNSEQVMTTGGTKKEYVVDVWSGNHSFYLGSRSASMLDADQVEKFRKKYAGLDMIMEIPVLRGEIVLPAKRKTTGKGKKK